MTATDVLKKLVAVPDRYIERDLNLSVPVLVLREADDGREVLIVEDDILDQLKTQSFVERVGLKYLPTRDGIARGLSIDYAAEANVAMRDGTVIFDKITFAKAVRKVMAMPREQRFDAQISAHDRLYKFALIEAIFLRPDFPPA